LLKIFSAGTVAAIGGHVGWRLVDGAEPVVFEDIATSPIAFAQSVQHMSTPAPDSEALLQAFQTQQVVGQSGTAAKPESYEQKMLNYEHAHLDDVFLAPDKFALVVAVFKRMGRVQSLVGHGNFNVICFDELLGYARQSAVVGAFPLAEVDFLEELFAGDARRYGFMGEKVILALTDRVPDKNTVRLPRTGHFLFRGDAQRLYAKLVRDLNHGVVLTSGIRGVVKQTHLFLAKTIQAKGNLSRASRSLAPPGHSFHGIGDFDVGKVGFGAKNFTEAFAQTDEFKRLVDLGYVAIRYPQDNRLGVRYEPWHIKVV
jgi:D-alanyl-D-alanine carboxypeptidase